MIICNEHRISAPEPTDAIFTQLPLDAYDYCVTCQPRAGSGTPLVCRGLHWLVASLVIATLIIAELRGYATRGSRSPAVRSIHFHHRKHRPVRILMGEKRRGATRQRDNDRHHKPCEHLWRTQLHVVGPRRSADKLGRYARLRHRE